MKLCIHCKHFQRDEVVNHHKCGLTTFTDPVDGRQSKESCIMERSIVGHCGPDAKFFEPVNQPKESERG